MLLVKFFTTCRWADPDLRLPHVEAKEGQIISVTKELAEIVVGADKGEIVPEVGPREARHVKKKFKMSDLGLK